jgi:alkanesulfonate monooxygenase SsuD/methylene tetrahydromethanopterin reductase-like flavin-dependent oxidoreductase (luciferase family)
MRLAKAAATLDVLSGGRVILGVGVGVVEQEFKAIGSVFAERGALTDETIAILQALWTQTVPTHDGRQYHFSGMPFAPKPMQKPSIPVVIGGVSRTAIRRAARVGNGWHPTAMPPELLRDRMRFLAEQAQVAGRVVADIPVSISMPLQGGRAGRYTLGLTPDEIVPKLQAFADLGVETVVLAPSTGDGQALLQALEMIAREVMPAFQ